MHSPEVASPSRDVPVSCPIRSPRLWAASLAVCTALSVVSAGQIYLRRMLNDDLPSWSNQLYLNLVAWLPWIPLGMVVAHLTSALVARRVGPKAALVIHSSFAHAVAGAYLGYLSLFRHVFFPALTGSLSWGSFLHQTGLEAGNFYLHCIILYALVAAGTSSFQRWTPTRRGAPEGSRDKNASKPPSPPGSAPRTLAIGSLGRTIMVDVDTIDWIEAAGSYVRIHTGPEHHLARRTLKSLELELAGAGFSRIHRSSLVNVRRVARVRPDSHGDAVVDLKSGQQLRMSRGHREPFRAALEASRTS